jgi:hypothetical protein
MKKLTQVLIITGFILTGQCLVYGQLGKTSLQHGGSLTTYTDLTTALTASVNGDTVYLPGGSVFASNSTITIDKNLVIIGAGHYPDSTGATYQTVISKNIRILTGADGGMLCGVRCNNLIFGTSVSNQNVNNYRIVRCYIGDFQPSFSGQSTSENILISENVIKGYAGWKNNYFSSVLFEKNIFGPLYENFYGGYATFNNCIFHKDGFYPYFFTSSGPCTFNNCIIVLDTYAYYSLTIGSTLTVFNGLLVSYLTGTPSIYYYDGTLFTQLTELAANTFMNTMTDNFIYTNNYHLKPTSIGHNAGTDGTDIGIYGTSYPYKEAAVPFNPHISSKNIGNATNPTGTLNVDIKVSAQDR